MKLSTARQLSLIVCTAALCAAASVDHRLDGFRAAPPVDGAPQASNLLEQARLSLALTDATTKEAVLRELVAFQRGGIGSFLKYMVAQQVANQALQQFLTTLENLRTDKQNGGGPNTADPLLWSRCRELPPSSRPLWNRERLPKAPATDRRRHSAETWWASEGCFWRRTSSRSASTSIRRPKSRLRVATQE